MTWRPGSGIKDVFFVNTSIGVDGDVLMHHALYYVPRVVGLPEEKGPLDGVLARVHQQGYMLGDDVQLR